MKSSEHHLLHPKYRPDIDGLRTIAVLSVVGYHAFPGWMPGGFVGVDVFFVISGYLISTIIFGNLEKGNFSYIEFYARRIKRIFPALLLVLVASMLFGWYVLFSDEFSQLGKHVAAGAGFVSNIALWSEAGYFDNAAELKPLLHLWSLGIEEQFYILWPILLGVVWRRKFNFLMVTLLVAIISFAINIFWVNHDPVAGFFLPFSRIWELMVGGILAYIVLHKHQYLSDNIALSSLMSLFGLVLIGVSVIFFTKHTPFPGWWALLPTMGAFLVIAGSPGAWVNQHLLSIRPMVWIGLISYPLYLWHWPLLSFARIVEGGTPAISIRVFIIIASVLLAWGTYIFVEKRFKQDYSKISIYFLALSMALLLAIGLLIWKGFLLPRQNSKFIERIVTAAGDSNYPGKLTPQIMDGETLYVKEGSKAKTLFYGDSRIEQYGPKIVRLLEENPNYNTAVFGTRPGCLPIPNVYESNHKLCKDARVSNEVIKYINRSDVETVVIGAAWNVYFLIETEYEDQRYSYYYQDGGNNNKHLFRDGDGASLAMQELEKFLGEIAKDKQVFLLLDNPYEKNHSPKFYFEGTRLTSISEKFSSKQEARAIYASGQKQLRDKLKAIAVRSGAKIIDPTALLCNETDCKFTTESGIPIYMDEGHLRPFFVEQHATYMDITLQ